MIEISVTGQTYDIRRVLKQEGFQWDAILKRWHKTVSEATLDKTVNATRPPNSWSDQESPKVMVTLTSVDIRGKQMNDTVLRFRLKPEGDRTEGDFLKRFNNEVRVKLSPQIAPVPPDSEIERKKKSLEGFF